MVPFDGPYTTLYWSAIVTISCTIFELFGVKQYRDLEIRVRGHSRSFKLVPFESAVYSNYGRIFSRLRDIQRQRMARHRKLG